MAVAQRQIEAGEGDVDRQGKASATSALTDGILRRTTALLEGARPRSGWRTGRSRGELGRPWVEQVIGVESGRTGGILRWNQGGRGRSRSSGWIRGGWTGSCGGRRPCSRAPGLAADGAQGGAEESSEGRGRRSPRSRGAGDGSGGARPATGMGGAGRGGAGRGWAGRGWEGPDPAEESRDLAAAARGERRRRWASGGGGAGVRGANMTSGMSVFFAENCSGDLTNSGNCLRAVSSSKHKNGFVVGGSQPESAPFFLASAVPNRETVQKL